MSENPSRSSGYILIPDVALDRLDSRTFSFFWSLARVAGRLYDPIRLTDRDLASRLDCQVRTLRRHLDAIQDAGLITSSVPQATPQTGVREIHFTIRPTEEDYRRAEEGGGL